MTHLDELRDTDRAWCSVADSSSDEQVDNCNGICESSVG